MQDMHFKLSIFQTVEVCRNTNPKKKKKKLIGIELRNWDTKAYKSGGQEEVTQ